MRFSMGRETNIESIRALEKQIEEGRGDTIKLKRARNSLLNISIRAPPEILGRIFFLVVARSAILLDGVWDALRRVGEGILQLPPRMPPLVRGRL
jgi:hypothetical protein